MSARWLQSLLAGVGSALRDQLLELVIMQDHPKTRRELFALGVH